MRFAHALPGPGELRQPIRWPDWPCHEIATAVGASAAGKAVFGAVSAERALERADQRLGRVRRQIAVAAFAVGSELEHG